ncbi:uncharacterized protein LOC122240403 isoform X5 [Panthera tigris]|uniref:uncharacterized protein LOC122240403 isoform X5 n=1 Tax=Panthera tigris TaxID=9694 RepID=UPI001C6FAE46|nr:uncharacterized protein LOC122240403 isoform X5 [Panthera tigris]
MVTTKSMGTFCFVMMSDRLEFQFAEQTFSIWTCFLHFWLSSMSTDALKDLSPHLPERVRGQKPPCSSAGTSHLSTPAGVWAQARYNSKSL